MARSDHKAHKAPVLRRGLMTWLAAVILFAQALAPLSSALAYSESSDALQVICTSSGVKMVNIAKDGQPVDPMQAVSCPFCVMHAASAAVLAPVVSLPVFVEAVSPSVALLRVDLHAGLPRAQSRSPRGPPLTV